MNSPSNTVTGSAPAAGTSRGKPAIRPLYWSLRREVWENRSIYIAPLLVAGLVLIGFLIAVIGIALAAGEPAARQALVQKSFGSPGEIMMAVTFLVAVFYCLDALHGERRDRSILFWKSLPVSDLTTVLAKAAVPVVVLPLLTFVITLVTQALMLLLGSLVLLGSGVDVAALWDAGSLFRTSALLLYHLVAIHAFWHAPLYAWLLLVSAWAQRAPFLWAVLPLLAIILFEWIAFRTAHFAAMLGDRLSGGHEGTLLHAPSLSQLSPGHFLATPGLWIGLAVAAAFLAAAVHLRRRREPV